MPDEELVATEISKLKSDLFIVCDDLKFTCDICKKLVKELIYMCDKCGKSMHPSCAGVDPSKWIVFDTVDGKKEVATCNLPNSCSICLRELEDRNSAQAPSSSSITSYIELGKELLHKIVQGPDQWMVHEHKPGHELTQMDNSAIYSCNGCKMDSFGLHYACNSCTFLLHRECNSPRKKTEHQFFPKLDFVFGCLHTGTTNVFCKACGMNVKGYYYHSHDGKNNLHPCCINLAAQTICRENHVKMVLKEKTTSKCDYCKERHVKVGSKWTDDIWSYVTENENLNGNVNEKVHLHVGCMIKMLSDMRNNKMCRLKSCKLTSNNGQGDINLELELVHGRKGAPKREKIKIFNKYLKIALGTVIAALLGDATTGVVDTLFY